MIPADESGFARLVLELSTEVEACVEMMSGAVWVRDQLQRAGWQVKVAHARKVRDVAPLACKTDKVDARVLAELCRRDLVPELWLPTPEDRALRERLRRRMHLVKLRTSARNRIFGLLTQFGLRFSYARLRKPDAIELLERRGVPEAWRASIAELLELASEMDRRIIPIDRELGPLATTTTRGRPPLDSALLFKEKATFARRDPARTTYSASRRDTASLCARETGRQDCQSLAGRAAAAWCDRVPPGRRPNSG
jgi:transposase